ncbi:MAG: substrate-binding domain-containing protein [Caldilinea sp.]|nr:substrate-binding domain-containing protein [Caldilinea sp.]
MSFKKHLSIGIALLVLLSMVAGCVAPAAAPAPAAEEAAAEEAAPAEGGDAIRVGVTMLFDDRWLTSMREAMAAYGEAQEGVEVIFVDSKEDVAVQLGQVENFITQGVDAIVVVPANTDATDPMTQAALDAGIPLVYVNRKPANLPEGIAFVGSDSIDAGIFQMEWIAEALGGQGQRGHPQRQPEPGSGPDAHRGGQAGGCQLPGHRPHQGAVRQLVARRGAGHHGKLARQRRPDRRRRLEQRRNGDRRAGCDRTSRMQWDRAKVASPPRSHWPAARRSSRSPGSRTSWSPPRTTRTT